jgi:alkanesulfonate monooxygenase SsuD/methylene tetrahydromethanopterin reductase-like flavin-dependent oxidoreductase (luciferase family)
MLAIGSAMMRGPILGAGREADMAHDAEGRRMKLGVMMQQAEGALEGRTPRFSDVREMALAAESVGFDSFWLPDHVLYRPGDREDIGVWEAFTFLAALGSLTSTMTLGPFVAASTFRNPTLLAKIADAMDEVTNGRFILAVGAGNWETEHAAFGFPFDHRVSRFEEALRIITTLLRDGQIDFHGTYYDARNCVLRPRGPSTPGPQVWAGSRGERMLRITAQYADAYNTIWPLDAATVLARREALVSACHEVGRDPETLGFSVGTIVHLPEDGQPATDPTAICGTYEEIAQTLLAFADAGVTHTVINFRPETSVQRIEAFGRVLEIMDKE